MKPLKKLSTTLITATMLISAAPGIAHAAETSIYMNPNAGITKYWQTNPTTFGQPLTKENCVKGKGCEQLFEKGLITWNTRNGVKALTGADKAKAFENAGGIAKFGALEGDSWNNTYCGPIVTTWDGTTRHLVVVADSAKSKAGSSIDLNSVEGKQWLKDRATSGKCFDAVTETPTEPTDTAQLDWSKATYVEKNQALVLMTDTTAYVIAADANGTPKAGATAFEVPFIKIRGIDALYSKMGYPIAAPVTHGTVTTQEFSGGTYTFDTAKISSYDGKPMYPTTSINIEGAKVLAKESPWYTFTGNFQQINDHLYVEDIGDTLFVFNSNDGQATEMSQALFDEYVKNPEFFGKLGVYYYNRESGYTSNTFHPSEGTTLEVTPSYTASFKYVLRNDADLKILKQGYIDHEPAWDLQDPATVDWSKATYTDYPGLPGEEGGALYVQDHNTWIIIKANADHTPVAGAKAVRSQWLGTSALGQDRGTWTQSTEWEHGDWNGYPEETATLGVPVAEAETVVENGVTYQTQRFEHGSIKWEVPSSRLATETREVKNAVISLDADAKETLEQWWIANVDWYKPQAN